MLNLVLADLFLKIVPYSNINNLYLTYFEFGLQISEQEPHQGIENKLNLRQYWSYDKHEKYPKIQPVFSVN